MDLKYIVVKGLVEEIIIFSPTITHAVMAVNFNQQVISAGFVDKNWNCYGESISLGVKSRIEDTKIAQSIFAV